MGGSLRRRHDARCEAHDVDTRSSVDMPACRRRAGLRDACPPSLPAGKFSPSTPYGRSPILLRRRDRQEEVRGMSSFLGSDPEAVRRFAQLLRDRQEALERTRSILEPAAQCDPIWKGPDGDSFRIAVRTDVLPVLIDVTSRFSTLAGEADAHADEQDGASAASDPVGVQTHLPPPASPRPEAPSRAGREGGRAHDRRGDGSEVGPPDGPLGSGLPDGLGDPVPGTTANDPGMTEWHPVDPGAGDWSSEDATIADHAWEVLLHGSTARRTTGP